MEVKKRLRLFLKGIHDSVLLRKISQKKRIKVVFLVVMESTWKTSQLYKLMKEDPYFDPVILVCPYTLSSDEYMLDKLKSCYNFFNDNGYNVISALNEESNGWINLESLEPDILFFTNPHNLTLSKYYNLAYEKYLSCYIPYHYEVSKYDLNSQYNSEFFNFMWTIFTPHVYALNNYKKYSLKKSKNVKNLGYPLIECLKLQTGKSIWSEDGRLKIIWAPHQTINNPDLPYSTFLIYADFFRELALNLKNEVEICFKPHPLLKKNLELYSEWGCERTKEYFDFWKFSDFTLFNDGDYINLFQHSDLLIHDCASFVGEYLHLNKPVIFMEGTKRYQELYNEFGQICLNYHYMADSEKKLLEHLDKFLNNKLTSKIDEMFIKIDIEQLNSSARIVSYLKDAINFKM